MKRLLVVAVVVLPSLGSVAQAKADGPCDGQWRTQHQVTQGIRCVWTRFNVGYGGPAKALDVARCESGLNPRANDGSYVGLFQHSVRYWSQRYATFIEHHRVRRSWGLSESALSGRTNSIVTALMVRRDGWGDWSCA